jgi:hypothetical protein
MNKSTNSFLKITLLAAFLLLPMARGATIFQAANSTYVAWQAEDTFAIANASVTTWVATNDAPAAGGRALYAAGVNQPRQLRFLRHTLSRRRDVHTLSPLAR